MSEKQVPRRTFLKSATALPAAPAVLAQPKPNDRLRLAVVGVGTRGIYLLERMQEAPNTEIAVICDLYDANLERAQKTAFNKKAVATKDWEKAVEAKDVDAVVIATPDFWHAPMAVRAAQAKKHIYVEKGLCRTLEEAKAIRRAVRENKVVLQLGHHQNSDPPFLKAREIFQSGRLGKTCLARTYIDRTNPWPEWQFYARYDNQQLPADATPERIDWERFQEYAGVRTSFDPERFFRWRCWWEYGTGIAGDLMSHQWDGVNLILGMGETEAEVVEAMHDLADAGCQILTIGQYLQPTHNHLALQRYAPPEEYKKSYRGMVTLWKFDRAKGRIDFWLPCFREKLPVANSTGDLTLARYAWGEKNTFDRSITATSLPVSKSDRRYCSASGSISSAG